MDSLLLFQLIFDTGLVILIWLVQLIIYPSFLYVSEEYFFFWHKKYVSLISLIVVPLILGQVGVELMRSIFQAPNWLRLVIIGVIWFSTFSYSVPCHNSLHQAGKNRETINRLIKTNRIRAALWSLLFLQTITVVYRQLF